MPAWNRVGSISATCASTRSRARCEVDGKPVELTPREFDLLYFFARHPGKVFSRLDLLNQVWGYQHDGYEHTVNTHINRLRMKVEADPAQPRRILTVWGRGYKLSASEAEERAHECSGQPVAAAVRGVRGAAARLLRRLGMAADGSERASRTGSDAAPLQRPRRAHREQLDPDGARRAQRGRGARPLRQADGGQSRASRSTCSHRTAASRRRQRRRDT